MTPHDLISAFEHLADAPDGVKRLRELVLHFAVRGQLVPQLESEAPARRLLGNRSLVAATPPWTLPAGWAWSSIDQLGVVVGGGTPSKANADFWSGDIPWVSPKDMKVPWLSDAQDHVSPAAIEGSATKLIPPGSVLMVVRGMILAHSFPVGVTTTAVTVNQDMKALIPFNRDLPPFLLLLLQASRDRVLALVERSTHGTCKLPVAPLLKLPLAIPPLAEQRRIVERVGELMGLLDRLEAAHTAREDLRRAARDSALAALRDATDSEAVEEAWSRISREMAALLIQPEDVKPLRQAVLGLAIHGRLVQQVAREGSAQTSLLTIARNRDALVKAKVIRRRDLQPAVDPASLFSIPPSWQWARLDHLVLTLGDGPHFSPPYVDADTGVPFLSTRNITTSGVRLDDLKYVSHEHHAEFCKKVRPKPGDVLYTKGGTTGIATVNDLPFEFSVWVHVAVLKIDQNNLFPRYLQLALNSDHCYEQSQAYTHGIGNKDLGLTRMVKITVPVPPLAEQHRIVAKVDALMAICDALEARLVAARELQRQFAAAAVHHLDA